MTRKSLREIQDYAAWRGWHMTITRRMVEQRTANLRGANLHEADLHGAFLTWANLRDADLCGADLSWADLREADLRGANLTWADLSWANLRGADLDGAIINWQSHDLIAEILRQAAGDNVQRRMVAGLLLVSPDWRLKDFIALDMPGRAWARVTLAAYVRDDDNAPDVLRECAASVKR